MSVGQTARQIFFSSKCPRKIAHNPFSSLKLAQALRALFGNLAPFHPGNLKTTAQHLTQLEKCVVIKIFDSLLELKKEKKTKENP